MLNTGTFIAFLLLPVNAFRREHFWLKLPGKNNYLVDASNEEKDKKKFLSGSDYSSSFDGFQVKKRTALGCGGAVNLRCIGGALRVKEAIYSCNMKPKFILTHFAKVEHLCNGQERCLVPASRSMFGESECPSVPDAEMKLQISYECQNGGIDRKWWLIDVAVKL